MFPLLLTLGLAGCEALRKTENPPQSDNDQAEVPSFPSITSHGNPISPGTGNTIPHLAFNEGFLILGEPQTLFASGSNLWTLIQRAGAGTPQSIWLSAISLSETVEDVASLPYADERSYSWSAPITINHKTYLAFLYSSNAGFNGQSGTHHGILITDESGLQVADHNLYDQVGVTGASAFAFDEATGALYVLMNNSSDVEDYWDTVSFGIPEIVKIENPLNNTLIPPVYSLNGYENASSMAFKNGKLIVGCANNTLGDTESPGQILVINPQTVTIENTIPLPNGVGINGLLPVTENGELVFTGNNSEGESIAVLSADDNLRSRSLPSGTQGYVANAMPVGSALLFNTSQGGVTTTTLLQEDGTTEEVNEEEAFFGISPIAWGALYCDAVVGTAIDDDSNIWSEVNCYSKTE